MSPANAAMLPEPDSASAYATSLASLRRIAFSRRQALDRDERGHEQRGRRRRAGLVDVLAVDHDARRLLDQDPGRGTLGGFLRGGEGGAGGDTGDEEAAADGDPDGPRHRGHATGGFRKR
jgi:hypothetical protein